MVVVWRYFTTFEPLIPSISLNTVSCLGLQELHTFYVLSELYPHGQ